MQGLDRLIALLRAAPLSVPVGVSEAIDAARVLQHRAAQGGAGEDVAADLRLVLRPVLCKAAADLGHFDAAFDAWLAERGESPSNGPAAPAPLATPAPRPPGAADAGATPAPRPPAPWWTRRATAVAVVAMLAIGIALVYLAQRPAPVDPVKPLAPGDSPVIAAPAPAPAPVAPAASAAVDDTVAAPVIQGFTPESRPTTRLRWPWWGLLVLLPALGLLPLLGAPAPLPEVTRRRGSGTLTLESWPPHKLRRQLVRAMAPGTAARLQRHVRGAVGAREAYARRPRLDERRTVRATLLRGGILASTYRFARLRPAYLVLVHAAHDDDLGVLWARRLAELDVRAAVFRFWSDDPQAEPVCVEVGGFGRRLPFRALPAPWPEQRLVVVARTSALVDPSGAWRPWVQLARLQRWAQRALFNPDEPRDWNPAHVALIEAGSATAPGMFVLPFEDNALDAWSDWLVRHDLPEIALEAPQLYPRLLRQREAAFVGDTEPSRIDPDPAKAGQLAQQLVTQLQAYLGQNGFYWLCACAVPPVLEPRLALLLGEEYFRRCGATTDTRVAAYMTSNWRLLVRLPWLREPVQQMPQWLRLTLLARLPPVIQDELREVVRGALGRRSTVGASGDGLALAFDDPTRPSPPGGSLDARHALLVGFVRDGLDARQLMLRLPGAWQQWLPALAGGGARGGWRASRAAWQRVAQPDPVRRAAAWRLGFGGLAASLSAVLALALLPVGSWPPLLHAWLLKDGLRAHAVAMPGGEALALASDGRTLFGGSAVQALLVDAATARTVDVANPQSAAPLRAAFAPNGQELLLADATGRIVRRNTVSGSSNVSEGRVVYDIDEPALRDIAFDRAGERFVTTGSSVRIWHIESGGVLLKLDIDALAAGWVAGSGLFVVWSAPGGQLQRVLYDASWNVLSRTQTRVEVDPSAALQFSPDGQHWLVLSPDGRLFLNSLRDTLAAPGRAVVASGVTSAAFSTDGRHIVVNGTDGFSRVLRASEQAVAALAEPGAAPSDIDLDMRPAVALANWPWADADNRLIGIGLALALAVGLALPAWRARRGGAPA